MDFLSIIGIIVAFGTIIGGNYLEGGHIDALLNMPAALIVVGGTIGAAMLQTPADSLRLALRRLRWVILPPRDLAKSGTTKIIKWATDARRAGLLGLEPGAEKEPDLFARKGLQLMVDGNEPDTIRNVLELESQMRSQRDLDAVRFYESMGGYAPTIGIIGAVMGLIHVMGNLADPDKLGPGIAVAFVATIYGVGLANLLFLPIASKMRSCARAQAQFRELTIEGLIAIAEGENPKTIERKLQSFVQI